jgi:hypothetical protein
MITIDDARLLEHVPLTDCTSYLVTYRAELDWSKNPYVSIIHSRVCYQIVLATDFRGTCALGSCWHRLQSSR